MLVWMQGNVACVRENDQWGGKKDVICLEEVLYFDVLAQYGCPCIIQVHATHWRWFEEIPLPPMQCKAVWVPRKALYRSTELLLLLPQRVEYDATLCYTKQPWKVKAFLFPKINIWREKKNTPNIEDLKKKKKWTFASHHMKYTFLSLDKCDEKKQDAFKWLCRCSSSEWVTCSGIIYHEKRRCL